MIGVIAAISDDRRDIYVTFPERHNFKLDESVEISRKKAHRSNKQNSYYWCLLSWCIWRGGLREQGHFSPEALHEDIKAYIREEHGLTFGGDFSTADLNMPDFAMFLEIVKFNLMVEFFGVDLSPWEKDYEEFCRWRQYHPDGTFRDFALQKNSHQTY